jgi:hypothetical protein
MSRGQSAAGGRPTRSAGGGQWLGSDDGVQGMPWARSQQEACLLRLDPHGRALECLGVLGEGEVGRARASIGQGWKWRGAGVGGGSMLIGGRG